MKRAPKRGIYPFITEGRRSFEYQACLWSQGRLKIGETRIVEDLTVRVTKSEDGHSAIVRCGNESNIVELKRWNRVITQAGPYGSWHTLGLAVDFSFRSTEDARDHLVGKLESAAAEARAGGNVKKAAKIYGEIAKLYSTLCDVWNEVAPETIWGNDWDDDGIVNGPDPDNEWSDLPHFEWHPGLSSLRRLTDEQRERVISGRLPTPMNPCNVCGKFTAVTIDDACRPCHEKLSGASTAPCVGLK